MAVLAVHALCRRFGGLPAVDGVDLQVGRGETLAVIGPNGAGKSTLLHLIAGIVRPTSGTVTLDGSDVTGMRPDRIRRLGVGTVLQRPRDFASMTLRDSVTVGAVFGGRSGRRDAGPATAMVDRTLASLDLTDRAGRRVADLTVHERRLGRLAGALAGHPRVLLVDEVMAGLHTHEVAATAEALRTAQTELGFTVILVEHVMPAVTALADRVAVLDFGRLIAHGRPDEVLHTDAVASAYLGRSMDHRDDEPADPRTTSGPNDVSGPRDTCEPPDMRPC